MVQQSQVNPIPSIQIIGLDEVAKIHSAKELALKNRSPFLCEACHNFFREKERKAKKQTLLNDC